ncbi:MAG: 50S ribosomal protein L30 [candidate division Zixibacteria bacterium]|nr:50S ribosomal protein L30 [candidate division Zixibacteria bacterium]
MAKQLKITLVKGLSGHIQAHRDTVAALGLRKLHHSVIKQDTPQIRGMVKSISYLLKVEEL